LGDLDFDTRVEAVAEDAYRATLSEDWNIWGPNGGYLAAVLLRAAAAATDLPRPASLAVQFLGRAAFEPVDLEIRRLRRTRRAEALGVSMRQHGKAMAEALVWFVAGDVPGLEHDITAMPEVAGPDDLRSWDELIADRDTPPPPFAFWDNLEHWPCDWIEDWPPPGPGPPRSDTWFRFRPTATFEDPVVDACRSVVILDTMGWPATTRAHAWSWPVDGPPPWMAPSLDLHVRFHRAAPGSDVLFCRCDAPVADEGLVTAEGRLWAADGMLLASAGAQLLCTPVAPTG